MENLNRSITSEVAESVNKQTNTHKLSLGPHVFKKEFSKTFKEDSYGISTSS